MVDTLLIIILFLLASLLTYLLCLLTLRLSISIKHLCLFSFITDINGYFDIQTIATIAPNLVPYVLKKVFSLEMVKNDIYLGGASKQNVLFSESLL